MQLYLWLKHFSTEICVDHWLYPSLCLAILAFIGANLHDKEGGGRRGCPGCLVHPHPVGMCSQNTPWEKHCRHTGPTRCPRRWQTWCCYLLWAATSEPHAWLLGCPSWGCAGNGKVNPEPWRIMSTFIVCQCLSPPNVLWKKKLKI